MGQRVHNAISSGGAHTTCGAINRRTRLPVLVWVVSMMLTGRLAEGQDLPHLSVIQPGGMPGLPLMLGASRVTNGVKVTWDGPSGYYQLYQKTALKGGTWQAVGGLSLANSATITSLTSNAFFRVSGPSPHYAGAAACQECHTDTHDSFVLTPHAGALGSATFIGLGGQTNASCLPCHSVGAGLPTGFTSLARTPQLAGVQCESCHGPAGLHAANPDDPTTVPRVELAAQVCGGCHNTEFVPASVLPYHAPHYEEWSASPHQSVLGELQTLFTGAQAANYIGTCGQCHSGTVREALLENTPLPDGHEAGAVGIACATCHEPHELVVHTNALNGMFTNGAYLPTRLVLTNNLLGAVYTNQLRNPLASLVDYSVNTSNTFANNYNPDINVCAQCHNDRGANWADSTRPPHSSLQYNMMLGTVGLLPGGLPPNQPGTHALIEEQCAACHMQASSYVSAAQPAVAGHSFEVTTYGVCANCHSDAEGSITNLLTPVITGQIQLVTAKLQQWATTVATNLPGFGTSYGPGAWEYTAPGSLSPTLTSGPPAGLQLEITNTIKMARFNLYLVQNDGSIGVHNPYFAVDLLLYAQQLVQQELNNHPQ